MENLILFFIYLVKFREFLGFDQERVIGRWKNLEYCIIQSKKIMRKLKVQELPSSNRLEKLGYSSFVSAVRKYHGGFNSFRKKISQEPLRKQKNYWKIWENVEAELKPVIEELGHFPTSIELDRLKKSSIYQSYSYFGGTEEVKKRLNYNPESEQLESMLKEYAGGLK